MEKLLKIVSIVCSLFFAIATHGSGIQPQLNQNHSLTNKSDYREENNLVKKVLNKIMFSTIDERFNFNANNCPDTLTDQQKIKLNKKIENIQSKALDILKQESLEDQFGSAFKCKVMHTIQTLVDATKKYVQNDSSEDRSQFVKAYDAFLDLLSPKGNPYGKDANSVVREINDALYKEQQQKELQQKEQQLKEQGKKIVDTLIDAIKDCDLGALREEYVKKNRIVAQAYEDYKKYIACNGAGYLNSSDFEILKKIQAEAIAKEKVELKRRKRDSIAIESDKITKEQLAKIKEEAQKNIEEKKRAEEAALLEKQKKEQKQKEQNLKEQGAKVLATLIKAIKSFCSFKLVNEYVENSNAVAKAFEDYEKYVKCNGFSYLQQSQVEKYERVLDEELVKENAKKEELRKKYDKSAIDHEQLKNEQLAIINEIAQDQKEKAQEQLEREEREQEAALLEQQKKEQQKQKKKESIDRAKEVAKKEKERKEEQREIRRKEDQELTARLLAEKQNKPVAESLLQQMRKAMEFANVQAERDAQKQAEIKAKILQQEQAEKEKKEALAALERLNNQKYEQEKRQRMQEDQQKRESSKLQHRKDILLDIIAKTKELQNLFDKKASTLDSNTMRDIFENAVRCFEVADKLIKYLDSDIKKSVFVNEYVKMKRYHKQVHSMFCEKNSFNNQIEQVYQTYLASIKKFNIEYILFMANNELSSCANNDTTASLSQLDSSLSSVDIASVNSDTNALSVISPAPLTNKANAATASLSDVLVDSLFSPIALADTDSDTNALSAVNTISAASAASSASTSSTQQDAPKNNIIALPCANTSSVAPALNSEIEQIKRNAHDSYKQTLELYKSTKQILNGPDAKNVKKGLESLNKEVRAAYCNLTEHKGVNLNEYKSLLQIFGQKLLDLQQAMHNVNGFIAKHVW